MFPDTLYIYQSWPLNTRRYLYPWLGRCPDESGFDGVVMTFVSDPMAKFEEYPGDRQQREADEPQQACSPRDAQLVVHCDARQYFSTLSLL